jgi:hypothetical protein
MASELPGYKQVLANAWHGCNPSFRQDQEFGRFAEKYHEDEP